ncbi:carbohydrate-binding protein [Halobacteria archaeon AArc-m2/3/4]|uniref:Carbohydrate-binding protein n=1 Tax=Natronoglomus mannanivorans TaxID=2979990 RepID=A0ABT2QBJ1_9EURY|nr:carbohydrate-binding protein [Halobacteria archaeon AArc-m2/3/4]
MSRTDGSVDIGESTAGSGDTVDWIEQGEWLEYTVSVGQTSENTLEALVSPGSGGSEFYLEADGSNVSGSVTVPDTGDWEEWERENETRVETGFGGSRSDSRRGEGASRTPQPRGSSWQDVLSPEL